MDLKNKVALVTGAANGIGAEYCKALINEGVKVAICDTNTNDGLFLEKMLNENGKNSVFFRCDVSDNDELEDCFKKAISEFGGIDIVVNNAGILDDRPDSWEKEIDINLNGVIRGTLLGLKYVNKGGVIVATSSLAGIHRDSLFPIYSATKGGVNYFVRSIGSPIQYQSTGVRVISISPGFTDTHLVRKVRGKSLNPVLESKIEKRTAEMYRQKPESVAACLVHILKEAHSGSVWLVENDKWRKIYYERLIE